MPTNLTPDEGRRRLRVDYPVWVRALCEFCSRELAELYGAQADLPAHLYWSEETAKQYPAGAGHARVGHAVTWRCPCGPNGRVFEVRGEKLVTAFHSAALHPDPAQRVFRVPRDVGEDVWGSTAIGGPGGSFAVLPDSPGLS